MAHHHGKNTTTLSEKTEFSSWEAFEEWKGNLENSSNANFVKRRNANKNKAGTVESVLFLFFASFFILAIFSEYSDSVDSLVFR